MNQDPLWQQPAWQSEVRAWILEQLAQLGYECCAEISQPHVRHWSTVMKIPTTAGDLYFKASMPALGYEAALTQRLAELQPGCMLRVLAVDRDRGWMLMPDEGPMLRTLIHTVRDLRHWEVILPRFARAQIELAQHSQDLLTLGALDRRLPGLPAQFDSLLHDRAGLMVGQPGGLSEAQHRRLLDLRPYFADLCADLSRSGLPETLHHDDFHDGNVFVQQQQGDLRYTFSDWGESCITHPFFTLLVTLRSIAYRLDLAYGNSEHQFQMAPELLHLRDLYLGPWQVFGDLEELRRTCDLAWRAAMANRALTWRRVIAALPEGALGETAVSPAAWLQEFLDLIEHDRRRTGG